MGLLFMSQGSAMISGRSVTSYPAPVVVSPQRVTAFLGASWWPAPA